MTHPIQIPEIAREICFDSAFELGDKGRVRTGSYPMRENFSLSVSHCSPLRYDLSGVLFTPHEPRRLLTLMLRSRADITGATMILNPLKQRPVNTLAAVLHRLRNAVRFCLVGGELRQDENCVLRVPFCGG